MVEPQAQVLDRWIRATREALRAGTSEEELQSMLHTAAEHEDRLQEHLPRTGDPDAVYDALPPGLIDIPTAARTYNVPRRTLQGWIRRGHLGCRGRLKGSAPGGGFLVIEEQELVSRLDLPPNPGGRPKKIVSTA